MSSGAIEGKGRPLRFLAGLGIAWIGMRALFIGTLAVEPDQTGQQSNRTAFTTTTNNRSGPDVHDAPGTASADVITLEKSGSPDAAASYPGVENLAPAPPAHMVAPLPDNPGAMHNMLWMSASNPDMGVGKAAPVESKR
ncbi:hypothetical protein [Qipengyuania sphaerica]|uniref:hypothetical protein n=1 Tax=Qipengyuania sphaerica TaxID=2867243 RepID=UPI001C87CA4A|nr:hypothetical protein [Qipengyuania sphaerica]MBX7539918.1 hypothetical protein [Qipengyuania sphaerica]